MKSSFDITSCIATTDPSAPLGLTIKLDKQTLYTTDHITEPVDFKHSLDLEDGEHELEFTMFNKTTDHTQVNDAGEIVTYARLVILNLGFDDIELNQIFFEHSNYTHNFNGNGADQTDRFYGELGCNGTVRLKFNTPVYLWLLEHL